MSTSSGATHNLPCSFCGFIGSHAESCHYHPRYSVHPAPDHMRAAGFGQVISGVPALGTDALGRYVVLRVDSDGSAAPPPVLFAQLDRIERKLDWFRRAGDTPATDSERRAMAEAWLGVQATRETQELEAEYAALSGECGTIPSWDRDSWIRGAMYAVAWMLNRRGAALTPVRASRLFLPPTVPEGTK